MDRILGRLQLAWSVREFLVCSGLLIAGLFYALFFSSPPLGLQKALERSGSGYQLWAWMLVIGPLMQTTGKVLTDRVPYPSLLLRTGGGIITCTALGLYSVGSFAMWGRAAFSGCLGCIVLVGVLLPMLIRDILAIRKVEKAL